MISSLLICLMAATCLLVNAQVDPPKIVDNRADFAYQVSVQFLESHTCGGTIINSNHLVTAASCVYDNGKRIPARSLTAVVGNLNLFKDTGRKVHTISSVFVHEDYNSDGFKKNNIAVLRVAENFVFSNNVKSIPIVTATPNEGSYCKLSGWGTTETGSDFSADLQTQNVPISSKTKCSQAYPDLDSNVFCAGIDFRNTCEGDIGGPLVYTNKLAGIVSGGKSCGADNVPRLYTEAAKYSDWIQLQFAKEDNAAVNKSLSGALFATILALYYMLF